MTGAIVTKQYAHPTEQISTAPSSLTWTSMLDSWPSTRMQGQRPFLCQSIYNIR